VDVISDLGALLGEQKNCVLYALFQNWTTVWEKIAESVYLLYIQTFPNLVDIGTCFCAGTASAIGSYSTERFTNDNSFLTSTDNILFLRFCEFYFHAPLSFFSPPSPLPSNQQNGRPFKMPPSHPPLRCRRTRHHQAVYPPHTRPDQHNALQSSLGAPIRLSLGGHTVGRPGTSAAGHQIMVQVRESTKGGGVQGPRCIPRPLEVNG
jgi:hypothetical protein